MTPKAEDTTVEKLVLKPSWLQKAGPEEEQTLPSYKFHLLTILILSFLLFFFVGRGKQLTAVLLVVWIAFLLFRVTKEDVKTIPRWKREKDHRKFVNLPLEKNSDMIERALKGRELSQAIAEERLRKSIIEKIKDEKGLSREAVKDILQDRSKLEGYVEDETIIDFLLNSKRYKEVIRREDNSNLNFIERYLNGPDQRDAAYERNLKKVIERISRWEGEDR
ncbi:MAG: hypothetical protein KGY76_01320 [Candidatus Thermoplasmatota archaeon]|nr:hypothetical protein [Candidatus Thermoplasmatota archaeon]